MSQSRFTIISSDAVFDNRLSEMDLRVLAALGSYTGKSREAWPRQSVLAERMGKDRKTINRACKKLEQLGYVIMRERYRDDGGRMSNVYFVKLDGNVPETVSDDLISHQGGVPDAVQGGDLSGTGGVPDAVQQEVDNKNYTSEASPPRVTRKRASQIGDYALGEKELEYAFSKGMTEEQARHEFEKFHNHFTGTGGTKKDWFATWRNWVIRSMESPRSRHTGRRPTQSDEAFERVKGQILQSERVAAQEAERAANQREQTLLDFDTEIPL